MEGKIHMSESSINISNTQIILQALRDNLHDLDISLYYCVLRPSLIQRVEKSRIHENQYSELYKCAGSPFFY